MRYAFFLVFVLLIVVGCQKAPNVKTDSGVSIAASEIKDVSPSEAQNAVAEAYSQFIDVRTVEEYTNGHAARAQNIPLDTLEANLDKLEKNEPVYIICQTGNRSKKAADVLKGAGFPEVFNVAGGTVAWQAAGLPMETKPPHNVPAKQ